MRDYARLVEDCDALIKAGRVADASKRLLGLNTAPVPREWRLPLANLCRRTGLLSTGMKLLYQVIHPERARVVGEPASAGELAEYGVLLHRFGSLNESVEILKRADPHAAPEALLFQAFCHFNRWEYSQAVPMLERYVELQAASYQKFIGEVNLSAALVWSEQWQRAMEVVTRNIATANSSGYGRLEGNSYELRAQIHIYKRDFENARSDLEASAKLLGTSAVVDSLFVHKWKTILEAFESKQVDKLVSLRNEAIDRRDGETAREADRFRLLISFDEPTFRNLLFGTPYPEFRKMLCRQMRKQPPTNEHWWGEKADEYLDARTGEIRRMADDSMIGRPSAKCRQLIDALTRDFYRPIRLGGLFAELFPGDHFDIFSSPGRVHQILFRVRAWAEEHAPALEIKEVDGFYSLTARPGLAVRVPYSRGDVSGPALHWEKLEFLFADARQFTAKQAREKLGLPRTSFQRLITWAEETDKVKREGEYNTTIYKIAG